MDQMHPLRKICEEWMNKVDYALEYKKEVFGQYATASEQLFEGPFQGMWNNMTQGQRGSLIAGASNLPHCRVQANRMFEAVALYGPSMIHQNPHVEVDPQLPPIMPIEDFGDPNDPMVQQQYYQMFGPDIQRHSSVKYSSDQMEYYLRATQEEADRTKHGRKAVTEAIVSGMSCCLTEIERNPGSIYGYSKARHIPQKRVFWDTDAKTYDDIEWMGIEYTEPLNRVSEKFQIPYDKLYRDTERAQTSSAAHRSTTENTKSSKKSHDQVTYYEIYSKNGFGQWLHGVYDGRSTDPELMTFLESLGRFTRIVVCKGVKYPLNMPLSAIREESDEQLLARVQWPTPFYIQPNQAGGWPVTPLWFYDSINCSYPMGIMRPALPVIELVNYLLSCLSDKAVASCETIVGMLKHVVEDFDQQMQSQSGAYKRLLIDSRDQIQKVQDMISFVQAPQFPGDIWRMIAELMMLIDKMTGLTDLIYGMSKASFRSATEAEVKNQATTIRPEDMADKAEKWLTTLSAKDMFCSYYNLDRQDFAPILGESGAMMFEQNVLQQNPYEFACLYKYRVAAGSARRMNLASKQSSLMEMAQVMTPMWQQQSQIGNVAPMNEWMKDFGDTLQINTEEYQLQPPPAPQVNPVEEEQRREEEKHTQQLLFDQQDHEQELYQDSEKAALEIAIMEEKHNAQSQGTSADRGS